MPTARYALYFAPEPDTALARFGRWWFGRDAETPGLGALPDLGDPELTPERQAGFIAAARRYGFHATLKAPFRLARNRTPDQLFLAAAEFARRTPGFVADPLRLDELDDFLALRPGGGEAAIARLAEACVRDFEGFRATPTAAELVKRVHGGLTPRQHALLAEWGYPYVMDQYRFHMTLTGRLEETERTLARRLLEPHAARLAAEPLAVRSVCLFVEPAPGKPFVLAGRFPLAGSGAGERPVARPLALDRAAAASAQPE